MPDTCHPSSPAGAARDWSDAFNALPLEAPATDPWPALVRRLGARRRNPHLPAWLGLAAAAALIAVLAWPRAESPIAPSPIARATQVATTPVAPPSPVGATQVATTPIASPSPVGATQVATTKAAKSAPESLAPSPAPTRLESLQAESARLEALVAVARDDRTGSAGTVLLGDAFDAQVAGIDAALSDPAIDLAEREQLWQARVDALQQAAGFFGTQRLMAAHGSADTWLVSVD